MKQEVEFLFNDNRCSFAIWIDGVRDIENYQLLVTDKALFFIVVVIDDKIIREHVLKESECKILTNYRTSTFA